MCARRLSRSAVSLSAKLTDAKMREADLARQVLPRQPQRVSSCGLDLSGGGGCIWEGEICGGGLGGGGGAAAVWLKFVYVLSAHIYPNIRLLGLNR